MTQKIYHYSHKLLIGTVNIPFDQVIVRSPVYRISPVNDFSFAKLSLNHSRCLKASNFISVPDLTSIPKISSSVSINFFIEFSYKNFQRLLVGGVFYYLYTKKNGVSTPFLYFSIFSNIISSKLYFHLYLVP